jgi:effector-binding domain-containing protein
MKKTLSIIIIVLTIGIAKAESIFTAQYPDKIIYNGKEFDLNSNPLETYFEKNPENRPEMVSTALWRGYVGHFEIIENELYLTDMKRPVGYRDDDGNFQEKWVSIYRMYFPRQEKVKIDWFSGILILPHGKMVHNVHQGYASTYSKYWLLEIENGKFNEARKYNNKEFVKFKKHQFEVFEKTEEYKKLYAELKKNDEYNDDEFIKSFISDFVINYTTKFLTE